MLRATQFWRYASTSSMLANQKGGFVRSLMTLNQISSSMIPSVHSIRLSPENDWSLDGFQSADYLDLDSDMDLDMSLEEYQSQVFVDDAVLSSEGTLDNPNSEIESFELVKRTYQPNNRKRRRTHGFLKRLSTGSGRAVLKRRKEKGRHHLVV